MRHLTLLTIATFTFFFAQAQRVQEYHPSPYEVLPDWAQLMFSESPNIRLIDSAYLAYYQTHPFEKTTYTQYYKHWRREVEPYVQADGSLRFPSMEEVDREERHYLQQLEANAGRTNPPQWTCIGPFDTYSTGGSQQKVSWQANVYAIDQSPSDPNVLYCGTEAGGVFKTSDKGLHWEPASYNTLFSTITAIKIHPTNTDIVYAGDGSRLYRTTDGGDTWETLLEQSNLDVNDISINSGSPQTILLATGKGLYRSVNGGQNWTNPFSESCWDLEIKPDDPQIVYLLKTNPAKKRCEFFKSTDQGATFSIRESGWYSSDDANRRDDGARMTVTPGDPNKIYVVLAGNSKADDNGFIGVFRSDDAGESWLLPNPPVGGPYTNAHPNLLTLNNTNTLYQGYYNLGIAAGHTNPNHVLIGGLNLWRTTDGAQTFTALGGYQGNVGWIHPDQQEIEINGNDMWVVNDGGINYSTDVFATHESRKFGITASDFWGFGSGWNEDLLVGGRYHNGNTAYRPGFGDGKMLRLGGGEASTGYVNPGDRQEAYFSDISSKLVPFELSGDVKDVPALSLYPNESYYAAHSSELEFLPSCYNCMFVGRENKLWRSDDGGRSFQLVREFGTNTDAPILHFEISRSNPDVIYVYQRTSFYGATLWRSIDGGQNWVSKAFPTTNSQRAGTMSLSAEDENTLWVAFSQQTNDGAKVFVTHNGGDTWTNLTTPTLDGHNAIYVFNQAGTDGVVYLGTQYAVFYRDNNSTDWALYNEGLPQRASTNIIRPFYKEGKLRMATYGNGIWESPMAVASRPIAQPTVDKLVSSCTRDTFYFDDYSILNHNGAAWQWSFPGASYVSDPTARNPRVTYANPGAYDVTLHITDGAGLESERTIPGMVTVTNGCAADTIPGLALQCLVSGDHAITGDFNKQVNALTISAWIKPDGIQNDYTGIVMNDVIAGFNFREGNNTLGYHWPNGGQWWWDSNLEVPPGQWSHVAMVFTTQSVTLYLNGRSATHTISLPPAVLSSFRIGSYNGWGDRNYKGLVDEVCIWDRALTRDEIRELRHLTKVPENDSTLIAYYQFNELEGQALDRSGVQHAALLGGATRLTSTAPVGGGASFRQDVSSQGDYTFGTIGVKLSIETGLTPAGEMVATRINLSPDADPATGSPGKVYWVINNYGANEAFDGLKTVRLERVGDLPSSGPAEAFQLYTRPPNADGDTWQPVAPATALEPAPNNALTFEVDGLLSEMGQLAIATDSSLLTSTRPIEFLPAAVLVYPNPVGAAQLLHIRVSFNDTYRFQLFDASGKTVVDQRGTGDITLTVGALPAGAYFYRVSTEGRIWNGRVVAK